MLKMTIKAMMAAAALMGVALTANAQDYTIRATANSNENDEDYDGLIVFKNYVEARPTAQSPLNCSSAPSFVPTAQSVCKASLTARSTCTFRPRAVLQVSSLTFRFWTFPT